MSQERWRRVSDLFDEVLDQPPEQRDIWLARACADEPDLEAEVRRMLGAHERAGILDQSIGGLASRAIGDVDAVRSGSIGPYRILREVGRGGMGVVYQAQDERLGRHVALKLLPGHLNVDPAAKHRLLIEARAASVLDHSGICTVYDVGETDDGSVYIAMAYYAGRDLARLLDEKGPLPVDTAVLLAVQIAAGLRHAHEAGVVHRDIKPSNILVTERGDAKILDFGVAKLDDASTEFKPGVRVGTVTYMSPEQAAGLDVDARTDLWSLGVVLYELLAGRPPFRGDDDAATVDAIVSATPPPLRAARPEVPDALEQVVRRMLAKDPRDRPADASALLAELRTFTASADLAGRRRASAPARSALPAQVTSFIGRDHEVGRVKELLAESRIVTLTGPAGTGKSRLALHVAAQVEDSFEHGAFLVPLAPLSDAALLASAIAQAIGVAETPRGPVLDGLKDVLRERSMLLVLDNFEHIVAAAPVLSDLLAACPQVRALVTSRVRLRVTGEYELPVPPLQVPRRRGDRYATSLLECASVALFVDRARAVRPDFVLDDASGDAVGEICRRLDGLPLAIELAAARTKLFAPQALLSRLDRRFDLLTAGPSDRPERHRTLRQAIAWSYELLDADQQAYFRRLAVFAGGCSLDSAAEVCNADRPLDTDAIDGVAALVDHSLVRREEMADGEPRFFMLETIREYAQELLAEASEIDGTRRAHAHHFLAFAEEADHALLGPDQGRWLDRLDLERTNLRAALAWAEQTGEIEIGLRIATAIWRFWLGRGYMRSGRERFERLLAAPPGMVAPRLRARALHGLATIAHNQGDSRSARTYLEECIALWREVGDDEGLAHALNNLAWVARELSDFATTITLSRQALGLHRARNDDRGLAIALNNLGWVAADRGEAAAARGYYEQSLALRRKIGDTRGIGFALVNLGWVEAMRGDFERADRLLEEAADTLSKLEDRSILGWAKVVRALSLFDQARYDEATDILDTTLSRWYDGVNRSLLAWVYHVRGSVAHVRGEARAAELVDESLAIWNEIGSRWGVAMGTCTLGTIAAAAGDRPHAERLLVGSLVIRRELDDRRGMAECLDALAALPDCAPERAVALLAAAHAERTRIGIALPPRLHAAREAQLDAFRSQLGADFDAHWRLARDIGLDAGLQAALGAMASPPRRPHADFRSAVTTAP
jgi:predicted ATPase/serine/threonine protein kinase